MLYSVSRKATTTGPPSGRTSPSWLPTPLSLPTPWKSSKPSKCCFWSPYLPAPDIPPKFPQFEFLKLPRQNGFCQKHTNKNNKNSQKGSEIDTKLYSGLPAVETVCRPNLVLPRKIHGAALAALVDWMYTGKLTVHRKALGHLPLVANFLKVNI